jgi:hypothetical protein
MNFLSLLIIVNLVLLTILIGFYILPFRPINVKHKRRPREDCEDCLGTGVINKNDMLWEAECPCRLKTPTKSEH